MVESIDDVDTENVEPATVEVKRPTRGKTAKTTAKANKVKKVF
jgi:hypothetical protein